MSNLQQVITSNARRTRRLELSEFHEDLAGSYIDVWLNLSVDFLERWNAYQDLIEERVEAHARGGGRDPGGDRAPAGGRHRAGVPALRRALALRAGRGRGPLPRRQGGLHVGHEADLGDDRRLPRGAGKKRQLLIPAVSEMVRKGQAKFPRNSVAARADWAKHLNRLNGCTTFHAWNVGQIPADDVEDLLFIRKWSRTISRDLEDT